MPAGLLGGVAEPPGAPTPAEPAPKVPLETPVVFVPIEPVALGVVGCVGKLNGGDCVVVAGFAEFTGLVGFVGAPPGVGLTVVPPALGLPPDVPFCANAAAAVKNEVATTKNLKTLMETPLRPPTYQEVHSGPMEPA